MPTRVVDVGVRPAVADSMLDTIRVVSKPATRHNYAALSHCWGGMIDLVLTTHNVKEFQASIPCSALASNFQDAIAITRSLGLRYLWIDSLCIIQDSAEDWEAESQKMGSVYRDAAVTIYASMSKGSAEGILHKTPKYPGPAAVQLKVHADPTDNTVITVSKLDESADENLWTLSRFSPLSERAWCLQEEVLSPRRLYFGAQGVYWQCPQGFQASNGLPQGGLNLFPDDLPYLNSILHSLVQPVYLPETTALPPNREILLKEYYALVATYCSRRLTVPSDKLPAVSGVAAGLAGLLGEPGQAARYLAGLWDTDIVSGLVWSFDMGPVPRAPVYRAPSWSWAATDGEVIFELGDFAYTSATSKWDLQIIRVDVTPKDLSNEFGEVVFGSLDVKGFTIPLVRSQGLVINARTDSHLRIGDVTYDELTDEKSDSARKQDLIRFSHNNKPCLVSVKSAYAHQQAVTDLKDIDLANTNMQLFKREYTILMVRCFNDYYETGDMVGQGLVLLKQDHSEDYERVGCLRRLEVSDEWMDSWECETLRIV